MLSVLKGPFQWLLPVSTCALSHRSPRDKTALWGVSERRQQPSGSSCGCSGLGRPGSVSHSDSIKRSESLTWLPPGSRRVICMIIQHEFAFVTEQGTAGGHGFCRARRAGGDEPQRVRAGLTPRQGHPSRHSGCCDKDTSHLARLEHRLPPSAQHRPATSSAHITQGHAGWPGLRCTMAQPRAPSTTEPPGNWDSVVTALQCPQAKGRELQAGKASIEDGLLW